MEVCIGLEIKMIDNMPTLLFSEPLFRISFVFGLRFRTDSKIVPLGFIVL